MENEEKKAAFIRQAEKNKENFDLHQKLIEKHFGKVEDSFFLYQFYDTIFHAILRYFFSLLLFMEIFFY